MATSKYPMSAVAEEGGLPPTFCSLIVKQLQQLGRELDFDACLMSRMVGDDWIVLQAEGRSGAISRGMALPRADSLCGRMLAGDGPQLAPAVSRVPAYADAPIHNVMEIGAYLGVPVPRCDGATFGTLCAVDRNSRMEISPAWQPLLAEASVRLSVLVEEEFEILRHARAAEHDLLRESAGRDGLLPPEVWPDMLESEESLRQTLASPAAVIILSVAHPAGAQQARQCLTHVAGDDLPIVWDRQGCLRTLCAECEASSAAAIARRVQACLDANGLSARCRARSVRWRQSLSEATETLLQAANA